MEREIELSRQDMTLDGLKQAGIKKQTADVRAKSDELLRQRLDEIFNESSVAKRTQNILSRFDEIWPVKRIEQRYDEIDEFLSRKFIINANFYQMQQIGVGIEELLQEEEKFGELANSPDVKRCSGFFYAEEIPNNSISHTALNFGSGSRIIFFDPQKTDIPIIETIIKEHPDKAELLIKNLTTPFIEFQTVSQILQLDYIPSDIEEYITNRHLVETSEFLEISLPKLKEGYKAVINTKSSYTIENECAVIPILDTRYGRSVIGTNTEKIVYIRSIIIKTLSDIR